MRPATIWLSIFVLLLSIFGIVLPNSWPLQFMFPTTGVAVIALVLLVFLWGSQVIEIDTAQLARVLSVLGSILLVLVAVRLFLPNGVNLSGFINHADLFTVAPLALAFILAGLSLREKV